MDLQTLHVAQLYQSVATFGVGILLLAEILAFWKGITPHAQLVRFQQQQQESSWMNQHSKAEINESSAPDQQSYQQKSAMSSLRRQINQYEKKANQQIQITENQPSIMPNQAPDNPTVNDTPTPDHQKPSGQQTIQIQKLDNTLKSHMLFYIEYNNFLKEHVAIIFSVLVIGMLTNSTRIFSLACFFCYLFTSLTFDFLQLEEKLKKQYKKGFVVKRIIKILSSLFIVGIFISYWCVGEFV